MNIKPRVPIHLDIKQSSTGVQMIEILTGYLINQFTVMIGQTALVLMIMLLVFNTPCHGNLALAVFVTFLQGFVGMCFGTHVD